MRALRAARRIGISSGILALGASLTPARSATCYYNPSNGTNIFALVGDVCQATDTLYEPPAGPPPPPPALPVPYTGFGFFAYNGGAIDAPSEIEILTSAPNEAYGVWSDGGGAQVNLGDVASFKTIGVTSYGLFASSGGLISSVATVDVQTTGAGSAAIEAMPGGQINLATAKISTLGDGAPGLSATGAGASISATGLAGIQTGGFGSDGIAADGGAKIALSGGAQVTTFGNQSNGLAAENGATVTLSGYTAVATAGNQSNGAVADGGATMSLNGGGAVTTQGYQSNGLVAKGGSSLTANGVTISVGGSDSFGVTSVGGATTTLTGGSVTVTPPSGASAVGSTAAAVSGGGSLIGSSVAISAQEEADSGTGSAAYGVYNGASPGFTTGGTVNLTDSTISSTGFKQNALVTRDGGTTTINGSGPATLPCTTSICTTGNGAYAVVDTTGGLTRLIGTSIGTTGDGSGGIIVYGAGSEVDATNVSISTRGGYDSVSGYHAYGLYNGPFGGAASGGVAKLSNTVVTTQGDQIYGVLTSSGGTTTITGGSIATAGNSAYAVVDAAGGLTQLSGASIATTGAGAGGISVSGPGSEVDATNVGIATRGGRDSASGDYAYGLYNGPFGGAAGGGVAKLSNTIITTQGDQIYGALTASGGTTTITGGSVTTSGIGSIGVLTSSGGSTTLNGASVATSGQDAHAVAVTGSSSLASLAGVNMFTTTGGGAVGLYAAAGGVISATGSTTISTAGGVSPATSFGANGVNADGAGSQIKLAAAAITTSGPSAFGLLASDATASGSAGSISVSGTLAIKTTNTGATAVGLQGNGASILASGGGTISSVGDAVAFMGGANQTATFDNFAIANLSGDLIFADPSSATVNFNSTTANAASNLLDARGGAVVTLNASASALTGAIQTDSASTTSVNLTSGSTWTMTGPSVVSNLAVTNSVVVFAPPGSGGAFKTLTVGNYAGTGANLTMNATLGGAGSAADEIIINGGKATGSTAITINNVGGTGGQTTGNGIPLIVATNGGTIAPNAFFLTSDPVVGGYRYVLQESNADDWYLVSLPPATQNSVANSVSNLARAQQQQIVTSRVLGSILLGATEQVNCSNCSSGFGSIGSYALGAHGRWSLSDQLTAMGGFSYNEYSATGITVSDAPTFAGSLVYDMVNWGKSRPFFEAGGGFVPYERVQYSRAYDNILTPAVGNSSGWDRSLAVFGRAGWVSRVTPIDEGAVYADISRNWLLAGAHSEAADAVNPYPASVQTSLETLNVARVGAQWTHLLGGKFEMNVSAAFAYGFGVQSGYAYNVLDFGTVSPYPIANSGWFEYGARIGYRAANRTVIDAFLLGTAGGLAGYELHGGVGLRYLF